MTVEIVRSDGKGPVTTPDQVGLGSAGIGDESPPRSTGSPLARILAAVNRFKWLILACTIVGTGAGFVASRLVDPSYVVQATLVIETPNSRSSPTPIQAGGLMSPENLLQLLRSYHVIDYVARERIRFITPTDPADRPVFTGFELAEQFAPGDYVLVVDARGRRYSLETKRGQRVEEGVVGDSIGRALGFRWAPTTAQLGRGRSVKFSLVTPREASNNILSRLSTRLPQDADYFIQLGFTDLDSKEAAGTLNAIATRFQDLAAQLKREKLTQLVQGLSSQAAEAQTRLKEAESALMSYQVNTITEPHEDAPVAAGIQMTGPTVMSTNTQLKLQLDALRNDRRAFEDVLRAAQTGDFTVDAFMTVGAVKTSTDLQRVLQEISTTDAELRALLLRYTPAAPNVIDVQNKLTTLRKETLPFYANAVAQTLKIQEQRIQDQINASDRELRQIPVRTVSQSRLQRDFESAVTIYKTLESEYQRAKLAEMSALPDLKLLDAAVPPANPTRNTAGRLIFLGFGSSLGLGLLLAILLDRIDRRFRYPEQVTQELRLHILGAVPHIRRQRGGVMPPEEMAQVVEAFRSIRLNLAHSFAGGAPITLTVTSPGPGDGKSLICSNLALSFAEAGYRTALVDGDTRRGELFRMFGAERRPGLIDYLTGSAQLDDILRPTSHGNLSLIPNGTRKHLGPELLGSTRMTELHDALKARFQVVILDSPPLGAGVDAFVLGTVSNSLLVVLRSGTTDREMAEAKLQTLDRLPVRILGAVLNDIRAGFGSYRYYSYIEGYDTMPEDGEPASAVADSALVSERT